MNAKQTNHDHLLDACIDSVRGEGTDDELRAATQRFRSTLPKPRPTRRPRWLRWAGAGLAAALIIAIGPQLMPGHSGTAFAAVQAWFKNYRIVHVTTVTTQGEREISHMDVWATADGAMRLETGPVVNILNPDKGVMYTLLPGKQVMTVPVDTGEERPVRGSMQWIEKIRDFQGKADKLPNTRTIDGEAATGYRLTLGQTTVDLWAATTSHKPLLMEIDLGGNATMRSRYEFDTTPPDNAFSVPSDYRPVQPER